jgi:flagellar motor switch protein FliN
MAKGTAEPEEEFNDQFILDDDMDDLSLDDDALFADLDNEIRLDGDQAAADTAEAAPEPAGDELPDLDLDLDAPADSAADGAAADDGLPDLDLDMDAPADAAAADDGLPDLDISLEMNSAEADTGDVDFDLDGEDMGKLDLDVDDDLGGAGLDDLMSSDDGLDDLMSSGDGLDDLVSESSVDDGLDDLAVGAEDIAADSGDLDMLIGESGEASDDELDSLIGDSEEPPAQADTEDAIDLNAFADELSADGSEEVAATESVDDELGDLDLSLGAEDMDVGLSDEGSAESGEDDLVLGDEELELPPLEAGDPMQAAVADLSLDGVDDLDFDALEAGDADAAAEAEAAEVDPHQFEAEADVDINELDEHLDALDASILEEESPDESEELPIAFSREELEDMGVDDIGTDSLEVPFGDLSQGDAGPDFSAVDDVDLGDDPVLELNLDNLESPVSGGEMFSNIAAPTSADLLDLPMTSFDLPTDSIAPQPVVAPQPVGAVGINTELLLSIPHQVNVEMGSVAMNGKDILALDYGSVVPLDRAVGEPVDLVLEGKAIAQGEIVLINGKNLGVRIVAVSK